MTGKLVFAHLRCSEFRRRNARKFCGTLHWTPTNTVVTHSISFPEEKLEHVIWLASFNPSISSGLHCECRQMTKPRKVPVGCFPFRPESSLVSPTSRWFLKCTCFSSSRTAICAANTYCIESQHEHMENHKTPALFILWDRTALIEQNTFHQRSSKYFGGFDQTSQCLSSHVC